MGDNNMLYLPHNQAETKEEKEQRKEKKKGKMPNDTRAKRGHD
jgi:hypothetical protein